MTDNKKPQIHIKERAKEIAAQTKKTARKTGRVVKKTGIAVNSFFSGLIKAIVVVTVCFLILFFLWREVSHSITSGSVADNNPQVEPDPFPDEASITVVEVDRQLEAIGEMATYKYMYSGYTEEKNARQLFDYDIPLTSNSITVIYKGTIKAGYEISDVEIDLDNDKHIIYVTLPDPIIVSNEIDEDSLQYKEDNNILNPLPGDAAATILANIKKKELKKAEEDGLYTSAEKNAKSIIKDNLSVFEDYKVQFK